MPRVVTYIDGFNLYFGMKEAYQSRHLWLNVEGLSKSILQAGEVLTGTKYFTSNVTNNPQKEAKQKVYLEALVETTGTQIYKGRYQVILNGITCNSCNASWDSVREKMTDVQIATHMLTDAFTDVFDVAVLVTGDTDLVPTIKMIKHHLPHKNIIVAFPPRRSRHAKELKSCADSFFTIEEYRLANNQLPIQIQKKNGYILNKPATWI